MRRIKPYAPIIIEPVEAEQPEDQNKASDLNNASGAGKSTTDKGDDTGMAGQKPPTPILSLPRADQRLVITMSGLVGKPGPDEDPQETPGLPPMRKPRPGRGLKPILLTQPLEPDRSESVVKAKTRQRNPSRLSQPNKKIR